MPETLSLSTGLSFGLLAGVVSGVCYLVANGLTWQKSGSRKCLSAAKGRGVVCGICGGDTDGELLPCICTNNTAVKFEKGAWFLRQVQKTISLMPWSVSTDKLEQIDEEREGQDSDDGLERAERGELRNVRHFLETLSARLAGGPLDRTNVAPLYDHPAYLPQPRDGAVSAASAASSGTSTGASGAHAQLKRLVARVVEEAAALPALARYAAEPAHTSTVAASTYEDLLATAILNKVIERYQTENGSGGRSSGIHSASASPTPSERSSPRSLHSRDRRREVTSSLRDDDDDEASDWEDGEVTDDALEVPRRVPFPEFGGDIVHTRDNEEKDYDEISGSDIQAADGAWEENWLFQKKKIKTLQSVPVPMLVPNSNTDYRAMIGDRDADDTTDLSDNASDVENEEPEVKSDMKRVLDSKHIIGGKPKVDDIEILDFEPDSLTSLDGVMEFDSLDGVQSDENDKVVDAVNNEIDKTADSSAIEQNAIAFFDVKSSILVVDIDSGPLNKAEFAVEEIHRNGNLEDVIDDFKQNLQNEEFKIDNHKSINKNTYKGSTSTLNGHELEGEYEETVAIPVQRYADSLRRKHFEDELMVPTRDTDPSTENDLIPGSIADRERKKWLNFVEMPNNPYSPEAIQKRLSARGNRAIFDTLTNQSNGLLEIKENKTLPNGNSNNNTIHENDDVDIKTEIDDKLTVHEIAPKSPSPRILKEVLAEEIPQFKRYGRDYYIKEAKKSSGGRKKGNFSDTSSVSSMNKSTSLDNFDTEFTSPGLLIEQFNSIASNQQFGAFSSNITRKESFTTTSKFNKSKNDVIVEYEDINDRSLFSAKPAYVKDDADQKFEDLYQVRYINDDTNNEVDNEPKSPPSNLNSDVSYISSSSNEDSIKIYNVQTGEIVRSTHKDKLSHQSCETKVDSNDNLDMPDKNVAGNSVDIVSHKDVVDTVLASDETSFQPTKLENITEIEEIALPKVKELAKIFVAMEPVMEETLIKPSQRRKKSTDFLTAEAEFNKSDKPINKQAYMHSLTARSISKEFREGLKLSMAQPLKTPGGSNELPEGTEEISRESTVRPESPQPEPGTIKTKLAFFESLKSKFNNK